MPIYEYKCADCGKVFEALQKFSDHPLEACVHCSGKNIEKLISRSSFVLKGSGWYKTDYAKKDVSKKEAPKDAGTKPQCAGCPAQND
ncbi:MAG: zinc ribbon domain-containing protein [Thermodesulfobacteriota bacterium]|nr:MAG: zinc ribbon domain-containing protein [Thermodesulfobacteriota bacterium]